MIAILVQTACVLGLVAYLIYTMRKETVEATVSFTMMLLGVLLTCFGYMLELVSQKPEAGLTIVVQALGILYSYPALLLTATKVYKVKAPRFLNALVIWPCILLGFAMLLHHHSYPRQYILHDTTAGFLRFYFDAATPMGLALIYSHICLFCTFGIYIFRLFKPRPQNPRWLSVLNILLTLIPPLGFWLYFHGLTFGFNVHSALLALTGALAGLQIQRGISYNWASSARYQALDAQNSPYVLVDLNGCYLESNRAARLLFPQLTGLAPGHPLQKCPALQRIYQAAGDTGWENAVYITHNNRRLKAVAIPTSFGHRQTGRCLLLQDVSETQQLRTKLRQNGTHDELTGLLNRKSFEEVSERHFLLSLRSGSETCALMFAPDGLQELRTKYGNDFVERTFLEIADALPTWLRRSDIYARYDEDSFAVLLPVTKLQETKPIAERIRRNLRQLRPRHGPEITFTASVGITRLEPARHIHLRSLLTDAEAALYTAQSMGGDSCFVSGL